MNVLALTILISVCLAAIFIVCFVAELKRGKRRGIEHVSLLPLDDDDSVTITTAQKKKVKQTSSTESPSPTEPTILTPSQTKKK